MQTTVFLSPFSLLERKRNLVFSSWFMYIGNKCFHKIANYGEKVASPKNPKKRKRKPWKKILGKVTTFSYEDKDDDGDTIARKCSKHVRKRVTRVFSYETYMKK